MLFLILMSDTTESPLVVRSLKSQMKRIYGPRLVPRDEHGSFAGSTLRQAFVEPIYFSRTQKTEPLMRRF